MAGRRIFGTGLLGPLFVVAFFFVPAAPVRSGDLILRVESFPQSPGTGSLWTLIILVDHPEPSEVRVRSPVPPPGLSADTVRVSPRMVPGENRPRTELVYRFTVQGRGRIRLGSFGISAGGRTAETGVFVFDTQEGETLPVWEGPRSLETGKEAFFTLSLVPAAGEADPAGLSYAVPRGFIMEQLRPDTAERARGVLLRLRVIPLDGSVFSLPQGRLFLGDRALDIPPLAVPVHSVPR